MSRPDIPVTISGDPRGFESALDRIRNRSKSTVADITASFARLKSMAGGPAALLSALGFSGAAAAAREAASSIASVGDAARRAGMDVKSFQELKFVAEQNRIDIDSLTDGLKELSLRADEFIVTGAGPAEEAFKRLGFTAAELKQKLKDPSTLFTEIIGKLQALDQAARIRVLDEIFGGTGGEKFMGLVEEGEAKIRDMIRAANDLGIVMDDDLVRKAEDVDRKFAVVATTIDVNVKSAIVAAAAALVDFSVHLDGIQQKLGDIGNSDFFTKAAKLLGVDTSKKYRVVPGQGIVVDDGDSSGTSESASNPASPKGSRIPSATDIMRGKMLAQRLNEAFDNSSAGTLPKTKEKKSSAKRDEYAAETASIKERIAALDAETAAQAGVNPLIDDYGFAVEKAAAKQSLLTAAKQAGKEITPELAAEIDNLATAYANSTVAAGQLAEKQDDIRRKAEEMRDFQKDLTRGIVDGFLEGKKAADIFADALDKIASKLLDSAFDSIFDSKSAGGSGLFDGLFSLFFHAKGGIAAGGRPQPLPLFARGGVSRSAAIFGEAGPEAAVPLPDGRNIPVDLRMPDVSALRERQSVPAITYAPQIDMRGASVEAVARLEVAMARQKKTFQADVINAVRDATARGVAL